jgi:hypothetical protein
MRGPGVMRGPRSSVERHRSLSITPILASYAAQHPLYCREFLARIVRMLAPTCMLENEPTRHSYGTAGVQAAR